MSQTLLGSICLTDIPQDRVTKSEKNGKEYLNVVVFINDQVDKYDQIASMAVSQSKAERESKLKPSYIGNFKDSKTFSKSTPQVESVEEPLPF